MQVLHKMPKMHLADLFWTNDTEQKEVNQTKETENTS